MQTLRKRDTNEIIEGVFNVWRLERYHMVDLEDLPLINDNLKPGITL
jgi:hypothetical protein